MPALEQVFHTRGLTLSQEYRQIRTVVRTRSAGRAAPFYATSPELTRVAGPSRCEVGDPCLCACAAPPHARCTQPCLASAGISAPPPCWHPAPARLTQLPAAGLRCKRSRMHSWDMCQLR